MQKIQVFPEVFMQFCWRFWYRKKR